MKHPGIPWILDTSRRPIDVYYSLATECVRGKGKKVRSQKRFIRSLQCVIGIWIRKNFADFTMADRTPNPQAAELAAAEPAGVHVGANVAGIESQSIYLFSLILYSKSIQLFY